MRRWSSIAMVLLMTFLLSACAGRAEGNGRAEADDGVIHFKLGYVNGVDSPVGVTAEKMKALLAQRMPQYTIDIYPSGQLGGERDMIEATQLGIQDLCITATTPLANFVPSLTPGELLYLIQDYDHADAVYQGEIGRQWLEDFQKSDLIGLGFTEVGFRQLCTNKPVNAPEDLEGMKLRVMECKMHVNGWKSLGCDSITMGWSDAYAGVQQKTIDAVEVPYCLIFANSVYEICSYVAETNHIYTAQAMIMSEAAWKQMNREEQKIWEECARDACAYGRDYSRNKEAEYKQSVIDAGVSITQPDLSSFRKGAESYYGLYSGEYGDIISRIQELAR